MAEITGTNLLDSVLTTTGVSMSDPIKAVTAARLQQMLDAGISGGTSVALVLSAASSEMRTTVPVLTDLAATVETAKTEIEGSGTGSTFTLTTGVDAGADFTGTDGDDTYNASVLTANDGDTLDGGAGNDVLNLETAANITDKFVTTGIETVNLNALGAVTVDTKSMTGLTTFNSNEAAGAVTVNNIADAATAFGVKGSATNSLILDYVTGALNGTADNLKVTLDGSSSTSVVSSDSGFETVEVVTTADSSLSTLTATGATGLTLAGSAKLTVSDGAIDSFSDYTISNTGQTKLGTVASVKTLDASANTGGIVQSTNATATLNNGTSSKALTMATAGGIVQTGSGADIINVASSAVFSSNSTIVKLGAGDDNLNLSSVSSAGEYIYGEAGNDTIYVGGTLTSSDLIDGGEGTDTLNFVTGTHSLIAKGIENVGVEAATTVNFVTTDTATAITDTGSAAVGFTNLLNGSTYTSTVAKAGATDDVSLGFKTGQAATVNVNLTKGTSGNVATTNAADVTVTLGAASTMATDGISLDATATKLTVAATGAFDASNIVASGTEKLQTVTVTGDKDTDTGNITNDAKLTSVSVSSTGGKAEIGTVGSSANTSLDVTVTKIEAVSSKDEAIIGNVDFSGLASTVTGNIAAITATGVDGGAATSIGDVVADTLGTVTATSAKHNATIGNVTAGDDTASKTDGTITALKASGYLAASIGDVKADKVDSIIVESKDTTTGGNVSVGALDSTSGGTSTDAITVGTVDISSVKGSAELGAVTADALGNTTITGGTTAELKAVTVTNTSKDSVTGNITVTAGSGAATLAAIDVETVGTITAKSTSGGVKFNDMTFDDANGVTVVLNGGTGSVAGTGSQTIDNTKGDITLTAVAGTTFAAGAKQTINGGTSAATDIDIIVDASAVTGNVGASGGSTDLTVENEATDAASSMIVRGGKAANFITLDADGGTVTYYGQSAADTITLKGSSYTSTINGEGGGDVITVGAGTDSISGGAGNDTIKVAATTTGDSDTIDGGGDTDTLAIIDAQSGSAVSHTFATDSKLVNVENITIQTDDGVTLNLSAQTEGFTVASAAAGGTAGKLTYVGSQGVDALTLDTAHYATDSSFTLGLGADTITLGAIGNSIKDTLVYAAGDSTATVSFDSSTGRATYTGMDSVTNFELAGVDTLNLAGTAALATTTAGTDGTDSTAVLTTGSPGTDVIKSHAISATGVVTFDDADTFASAVTLSDAGDVAAAIQYLSLNDIGDAGMAVIFAGTGNGGAGYTVYQQTADTAGETGGYSVIELVGVTATGGLMTSGTTAATVLIA